LESIRNARIFIFCIYVCNISDSWYPFQVRVGFLHSSSDGCKNTKCLAQHKGAAHKVQLRHFLACVSHANLFIRNGWLPFSQKIQKLWFEINSNFVENLFTNFRLEKLLFFCSEQNGRNFFTIWTILLFQDRY